MYFFGDFFVTLRFLQKRCLVFWDVWCFFIPAALATAQGEDIIYIFWGSIFFFLIKRTHERYILNIQGTFLQRLMRKIWGNGVVKNARDKGVNHRCYGDGTCVCVTRK